ncbi:MAG TPA: c-type cytochrome, partial [Novosphingobium sp.]|nr:c-type cytochrome [Novosphingobium sp.]
FAQCRACHTDVKGARSTVGPNLSGVVGRKAGSLAGFAYSPAMKAAGIVWTPARIAAYLAAPARAVPGNRMGYAGMASPGDRADLVAYLESLR